ncbi:glycoside hydrolase family 43 protein [Anaerosporobacter sp.]|uniref:glycoside hydrolase family 43 protein n=1 Tax=Anaerosporobacter sp. TaxID=1872529 RepID=UPI00286F9ECA|nr:glycoside hydrolase family 43 protein [Anaerosporobacter sp.]
MKYTNPIISGFHPDPSICRVEEDYYLVTSSFEFFPAIPLFHSKNLVDWEQIGHCVTKSEYLPLMHGNPNASGIYAPTIRYHDGTFYVICTNVPAADTTDTRYGNFIVKTTNPYGEWSEPIWIDCKGIDPSLFFDEDGKAYFCGTNGGIYFCQINPDTGEILSEQKYIWNGTGGCAPEAPHIYKRGDWYYLMIAEGGTEYGHMETIARSRTIEGPYEAYEKNPILTNRSLGLPIMATGHADLIEDNRHNWWAVCLGIRPISYPNRHNLGRETFLAPVKWTEDEWPIIGNQGVVEVEIETNLLEESKALEERKILEESKGLDEREDSLKVAKAGEPYEFYDDFSSETLHPRWAYQFNPDFDAIKHDTSGLWLKGKETTLSDASGSTLLAFRQMHHTCSVRFKMNFQPQQDGEEAGIAIYMNRDHHYEMALTCMEGKNYLIVRRRIGSLWRIEQKIVCEETELYMELDATMELYRFRYSKDESTYFELGSGETTYLTTEVGGKFTGNFIAFYATGNGQVCENPACIEWVHYKAE